jgi:hypothetical protein
MNMTVSLTTTATATNTASDRSLVRSLARAGLTFARLLLGLSLLVFGLNGFFNFLPAPSEPIPDGAMQFAGAMFNTGYLFQLVKGTEVLVGALLLANLFVPLALAIFAPVAINILAFHLFLAPTGSGPAIAVVALTAILAWSRRDAYRPMLRARA